MDEQLAFVICPPRSGSTLLSRMLASHPDIYCRPEPQLIPPLYHLGYYGTVAEPRSVDKRHRYDPEIARAAMVSIVAELPRGEDDYLDALRAYLDTIYGRLLAASGKRIFVDKTPGNSQYLDLILKLYPRARFLVLTRHPVAVMLSLRALVPTMPGFTEGPRLSYLSTADKITLMSFPPRIKAIAAFLRDRPAPYFHLRYEDFVASPAPLEGICAHLGLPYDPAMLDYANASRGWVGPGDPMSVARHDKPLGDYVDKWKSELSSNPERIPFVRRVLRELSPEDVATWGYSLPEIQRELEALTIR
jgi:hypothetical protein